MVRRYPLSSQPFIAKWFSKRTVLIGHFPNTAVGRGVRNKCCAFKRWVGATRFASCDARPAGSSRFWLSKSCFAITGDRNQTTEWWCRGKAVDTRRPMPNLPCVASHATGTRKLRLCSPVCSVYVTVKQSNASGVEQSIPQIPPWADLSSVAALPRGVSGLGTVSRAKMPESYSSETYCREKPVQLFSVFDWE